MLSELRGGNSPRAGRGGGRRRVFLEITLFHPQGPHCANRAGLTLLTPIHGTLDLVTAGMDSLQRIYRPGYRYGRVSVMLLAIGSERMSLVSFEWPLS